MIFRNNTRRFSLLALLLAFAVTGYLSFTSSASNASAGFSSVTANSTGTFQFAARPTTTTLNPISTPLTAGQTYPFSGQVSSTTAVPDGRTVNLLLRSGGCTGSESLLATITTTGGNGSFSGTFPALSAGTWGIYASFPRTTSGVTTWAASASACQTITVQTVTGCVVGWGDTFGYGGETPPAGLSNVTAIAAGYLYSLALKSDGTVVGWGNDSSGQATPPAGLSGVTAIAAGYAHSLALKSDGTVVGWGDNSNGQATPPAGLSNVVAISGGGALAGVPYNHSLALKSDGTVVGWGDDTFGQATPPAGLSNVVAISAGGIHSLALKSDGTVIGWGSIGAATPPAGLSNVVAISAGAYHSLALKSDGTVVGWRSTLSAAEIPPAGLSNVTAIAAGTYHSLALKSDATVVGWGDTFGSGAETPPASLSSVTAISAGAFHSLAQYQCAPSNNPPTISAEANSRQQGVPASASTIATVDDADQSAGSLTVTVNGGASATVNGVTVSGLTNTNGTISATIGASCTASNASFTLEVTDSASATATATLNVTVAANSVPTIGIYPSAGPIVVGSGTTVTPSAAPADNVSVASVTVAGSAGFTGSLSVSPTTGVVTITNAGPAGMWLITVTATDNCGATNSSQFTLTVNAPNTAPIVTVTGPASGSIYAAGTPDNFTGTFTDDAGDTHTGNWMFDTITQAATIVEPSGSTPGSANAVYTFTQAGVYTVKLTVTDQGTLSGTATTVGEFDALVVIYDPSAGWVTGGGWINSPAGAYVPDPMLYGKANFGFVSKYQNGASVPTGNTEFHFKAGNLKFKSTSYEWMVIAGARAQYKGVGTINGAGSYRFMLTATDGQSPGGGGQDKFRIRIWSDAGGLVYDNQMNDPDSNDPTTVLGGGSIQIHN